MRKNFMNKFQDAIEIFIGLSNVNCVSDESYVMSESCGNSKLEQHCRVFLLQNQTQFQNNETSSQ